MLFQYLPIMMGNKLKREDYLKDRAGGDSMDMAPGAKSGVDFSLFKKLS